MRTVRKRNHRCVMMACFALILYGVFIFSVAATREKEETEAEVHTERAETQEEIAEEEIFKAINEVAVPPKKEYVSYYTEEDITIAAKILGVECRGMTSDIERACVVWTICNRADNPEFGYSSFAEAATAPAQFAYYTDTVVEDDMLRIASDVLERWNMEKNGDQEVGRVLPPDFCFFCGDGEHNYFRNGYKGDFSVWDYSLESPYDD